MARKPSPCVYAVLKCPYPKSSLVLGKSERSMYPTRVYRNNRRLEDL